MVEFSKDYFIREIESITRVISQILFHTRLTSGIIFDESQEATESGRLLEKLRRLIKEGAINDAENQLFASFDESPSEHTLETAMLFYNELNELEDETLDEADFTREEISEGLKSIYKRYLLHSGSNK